MTVFRECDSSDSTGADFLQNCGFNDKGFKTSKNVFFFSDISLLGAKFQKTIMSHRIVILVFSLYFLNLQDISNND